VALLNSTEQVTVVPSTLTAAPLIICNAVSTLGDRTFGVFDLDSVS